MARGLYIHSESHLSVISSRWSEIVIVFTRTLSIQKRPASTHGQSVTVMPISDIVLLLDDWKPHDDVDTAIHLGYAEQAARILAGDETAFEELIFALSRSLESYARRFLLNADLAQDAVPHFAR